MMGCCSGIRELLYVQRFVKRRQPGRVMNRRKIGPNKTPGRRWSSRIFEPREKDEVFGVNHRRKVRKSVTTSLRNLRKRFGIIGACRHLNPRLVDVAAVFNLDPSVGRETSLNRFSRHSGVFYHLDRAHLRPRFRIKIVGTRN